LIENCLRIGWPGIPTLACMTISPGTHLGPFEVVDLLGAGGMAAVYRARDPRLHRDVAIKVLPPGFRGDPNRLRRFEQEAQAVARLAHPNIVAVHDIGSYEGSPYIVTELLEGGTLREKMNRQPVPVRTAIEYATQLGHGLAAAHERGIVHRDIKPENVFVTREGRVKILDFGIARLTDVDEASAETAITLTGHRVLGTAAYMSPEQACGTRADHRADLFSLGVVLYEMVAGVSPFLRGTAAETMTAILREQAPDLPDTLACPPGLRHILRHCLEKDPAARFQTARDLVFNLEAVSDTTSLPTLAPRGRFSHRLALPFLAAGALALTAVAAFLLGQRTSRPDERHDVTGIYRFTDFNGLEEFPAIAPDEKSVAFTARVNGFRQIFVRLMAGGTPLQVTKTAADHELPRWSRDASEIIYFSPAAPDATQGTIWSIPALGGAPRRVIDSVGGGDIGPDGRIACFRASGGQIELVTVSPESDDVRAIARFPEPVYYKYPRWSPDSKWIAYQRGDGVRWDIFAISVDQGTPRQLTHDNCQLHGLAWLPDSKGLIYSSSRGTTMGYLPTQALWQLGLEGGEVRPIAPADLSYLHPDVHASGAIVASRLRMQFDLWTYPTDGTPKENVRRARRITRQSGQVQTPTVGVSDQEVAFLADSGGHANVWVTIPETGELRQITYERDPNVALGVPIWSPDGKWIAFVSSRGNTGLGFGVWLVSPDGGNLRNLAARGLGVTWSPDAQWVYYTDAGVLYKVATAGGSPVRVRPGPVRNAIGFDGKTLYFMVDRTLTDANPAFEIHAATPEAAPSRLLARIPASRAPQWQIINPSLSSNGQSLAMPLTDGVTTNIWTLATSTGEWRQITDFGERPIFIARRVSWSADGRHILAAIGEGDADIVVFEAGDRSSSRRAQAR
jgi:eukaryotic-like serine/threonine-protein kinase